MMKSNMEVRTKLRNLVLYVLAHQDYQEGGIKKLNKLLYFIDFYFYRDHERLISGAEYAKADMGPILNDYRDIFKELESAGDLKCQTAEGMTVCTALKTAELSGFTPQEVDHVSRVLDRYGKLSGRDLELISHQQQPWVLTENFGDIIDPDLALLIEDDAGDSETSIIKNSKLKEELQDLANCAE
ncbi:MAG: Panacea domain-containing protein [Patescibacteria group bacterium]